MPLTETTYGQELSSTVEYNIKCDGTEERLIDCIKDVSDGQCTQGGVRCGMFWSPA